MKNASIRYNCISYNPSCQSNSGTDDQPGGRRVWVNYLLLQELDGKRMAQTSSQSFPGFKPVSAWKIANYGAWD